MVNVSKHQKVQSCFSFFALKKSFWRIIALQKSFCQKWLSRKKVRLQQWKKVSVAFCKKDWIWNNNNLCVAKKIARTKKTTKRKKCLESPFLLRRKNYKKKMQCSRSWSVVENLFLSTVFLSAWKRAENITEKRCLRSCIQS